MNADYWTNPNSGRPIREWLMWRWYCLGCHAHRRGHDSTATLLWRIKDWFARGRTDISVIAVLATDYPGELGEVVREFGGPQ
jgi:hypothetical protein